MAGIDLAPALRTVRRGALCSGCGACAALAPGRIGMGIDGAGFLRPQQSGPVTAAEDRAIAAVCPGLGQTVEAGGRIDDPLWGPYLDMRTGWATDPALRHAGASGGALSALAAHLLASGTVDGVVQIGADPDRPVGNVTVLSTDSSGVLHAAGSRYAPSSPLAGLADLLGQGRRLAFLGKPCDAVALRAMAARDPRVAETFPLVLSFFCAGVPSLAGAERVLEALGAAPEAVAAFRYRGNGWPGQATATLTDGSARSMSYHDSWGGILSRHVQHRCKICADGTGVAADIVCADAWETDEKGYPSFADAPGTSLIVARTEAGARLLADAERGGALETAPFDPATLAAMQPGQTGRRRALLARLAALRVLGRPVPRYRGLRLVAAARQGSAASLARNFAGTLKRALSRRAPR